MFVAVVHVVGRDEDSDGLFFTERSIFDDAHFHLSEAVAFEIFFFAVNDQFFCGEIDHVVVGAWGVFLFVFEGVGAGIVVVFEVTVLTVRESHILVELEGGRKIVFVFGATGAWGAVPGAGDVVIGSGAFELGGDFVYDLGAFVGKEVT